MGKHAGNAAEEIVDNNYDPRIDYTGFRPNPDWVEAVKKEHPGIAEAVLFEAGLTIDLEDVILPGVTNEAVAAETFTLKIGLGLSRS